VYIVVLNVLYDDVYMYKSVQITFLFCSVLSLIMVSYLDEMSHSGLQFVATIIL